MPWSHWELTGAPAALTRGECTKDHAGRWSCYWHLQPWDTATGIVPLIGTCQRNLPRMLIMEGALPIFVYIFFFFVRTQQKRNRCTESSSGMVLSNIICSLIQLSDLWQLLAGGIRTFTSTTSFDNEQFHSCSTHCVKKCLVLFILISFSDCFIWWPLVLWNTVNKFSYAAHNFVELYHISPQSSIFQAEESYSVQHFLWNRSIEQILVILCIFFFHNLLRWEDSIWKEDTS